MNIRHITLILFTLLFSAPMMAQSAEDYVKEGIKHHDNGNYDLALELYKKALDLEPNSSLVNYEIALSYFAKKDYENVVKYSDVVLKQDGEFMIQAYITKGSALDLLGKTKESIKLFKKAIKKTEGNYLLYYNLALNYYKNKEFKEAENNLLSALESNPNHASSHIMLADIHNTQGHKVQTLLAIHYFLFLEPNSKRSQIAYEILMQNFGGNVNVDKDNPNQINIMISPNADSEFSAAELMVSMLEASKSLEENEGKSDDEMFVENTESFFKAMGELKKDKSKDIWWDFYTPFFYDLAKSQHLETYCKYITQSGNENSSKWITDNEDKLIEFDEWLKAK